MPEKNAYLTQLRTEHARVSALLASLDGAAPLNEARAVFLSGLLAALEEAIRVEEAR
jgi:hypothetical protein